MKNIYLDMTVRIYQEYKNTEYQFDVKYTIADLAQYFSMYFGRKVEKSEYRFIEDLIDCGFIDLYEIEKDEEFKDIVWDNHSGEFDL